MDLQDSVFGTEVLSDPFFFIMILDNSSKGTAAPILVKTLVHQLVGIQCKVLEDRLADVPWALGSNRSIWVVHCPWSCLLLNSIMAIYLEFGLLDSVYDVDKLRER